jgi:hypothetical protein
MKTKSKTPAQQFQFEREFSIKGSIKHMLGLIKHLRRSEDLMRVEIWNLGQAEKYLEFIITDYAFNTERLKRQGRR